MSFLKIFSLEIQINTDIGSRTHACSHPHNLTGHGKEHV